ncbi:Protein stu1 [Trichinella pseudospiralis]
MFTDPPFCSHFNLNSSPSLLVEASLQDTTVLWVILQHGAATPLHVLFSAIVAKLGRYLSEVTFPHAVDGVLQGLQVPTQGKLQGSPKSRSLQSNPYGVSFSEILSMLRCVQLFVSTEYAPTFGTFLSIQSAYSS